MDFVGNLVLSQH